MAMSKGLALAVGAWAVGFSSVAWALPVLDAKDAAVRIATPDATTMNITSTIENSNHVIKWVDFSIAGGETVTFDNRNYLNYVTGHAASEIFGTLTGGGHIYIVNPNGILIGDGATVNVGNLHLSTRTLTDAQLAAFTPDGKSPLPGTIGGDVINLGTLNATSISVEGNVIKFKNVAEVEAPTIDVAAKTETHVGYVTEETNPAAYGNLASAQWYKLVRNENELQNMGLTGNYMLARDMEVNGKFTAIGGASGKFKGHFDGLGHKVEFTKLAEVKANGSKLGLFGEIFEGATVENVGVITSNLDFLTAGNDTIYVGGVVGYNNKGTIRNVWHSGDICIEKSASYQYVGGIVGCNDSGTVISAYNIGDVSASGTTTSLTHIGGIVGNQKVPERTAEASIENAYNAGTVEASGAAVAGGILGANRGGHIKNVYNLGSVSALTAGGIIGRNDKDGDLGGDVSYAYHACGSSAGTYRGAIVGARASTGTFDHVFFETKDAAGNTLSDPIATTGGKESLKTAQTFLDNGWDISTTGGAGKTWRIYDGQSMPLLTAFLKPKDNIRVMEEDGTQPAGTYGLADAASVMVSAQLRGYEKGYDYVSDVVCIVPKEETTEPEPTDITPTPAITEPSEPTNPTNPSNPTPPTNLPETTQPSVIPNPATNPPDETNIPDRTTTKPSVITEPSGTETKEKGYDFDADYKQEMVVLHRPGAEKPRVAADENEAKNLVIAGNVVRLPDAIMRVEEVEAMMAEAEAQDSRVAEDETDGSKQS